VATIRSVPLDRPLVVGGVPSEIGLRAVGRAVEVVRDGVALGTVRAADAEITGGRVLFGVFTERGVPQKGPYEVAFTNVRIWGLPER
jgi:hypothetical protein